MAEPRDLQRKLGEAFASSKIEAPEDFMPPKAHWARGVTSGLRRPVLAGVFVVSGFIGVVGLWSTLVPISAAAIAPGVVSAPGQNLSIQHFEGGIIRKISVGEGARVSAGEAILELDPGSARSNVERLARALVSMQAEAERLTALRDGRDSLTFSSNLTQKARELGMMTDLAHQVHEFNNRQSRHRADIAINDQRIAALRQQISGLESQKTAAATQRHATNKELEAKSRLLKRRLIARSEIFALERRLAETDGRLGALDASVGEAQSAIAEARETKNRLRAEIAEMASGKLNETRRQITDLHERLKSAREALNRVIVRAPSDGVVIELHKNTIGGTVASGETLVTLLPIGGELVVEARLGLNDIDNVGVGQAAHLRFPALKGHKQQDVAARVAYVSADRLVDQHSGEPYFAARLVMEPQAAGLKAHIVPGMPVEAYINTGERTFLGYLVQPLTDSLSRAFREE